MAAIHGKVSAMRCKLGCQSACRVPPPARQSVVVRSTGWADPAATRAETAMFGEDFGARDPTPGEIESNFTEKTLGNYNTDHVIKIPQGMKELLGLPTRTCAPTDQLQLLEEKELNLLKQQVPGWKVITNKAGHQAVRYEWRVKNAEAGTQLQALITDLAQEQHHTPDLTLSGDLLTAELSTAAVKGLSMNDFIMAAKINELPVKELLTPPRKRFWA